MRLKGKSVLITGGASGIGRAIAESFARYGAVLAIVGRRPERLHRAADEIAAAFPGTPRPLALPADVTDPGQTRAAVETCRRKLGGVNVLVNNAGISVYGDTERTGIEDFRSVLETNFFGALNCMMAVLPVMRRKGRGLIVNVASVAALHGVPYLSAYSASKAALAAASHSLRAELRGSGIDIMVVYPGYTDTDIFDSEKKVGGARRPPRPYTPPGAVAEAVARAVQGRRNDLVFTLEGKALNLIKGFVPGATERTMMRMAVKLRDKGGRDGQAQA